MATGSSGLHLAPTENYAWSAGRSMRDWVGQGGGLPVGGENPFHVTELRRRWPALGLGLHSCFSFHLNPLSEAHLCPQEVAHPRCEPGTSAPRTGMSRTARHTKGNGHTARPSASGLCLL